MSWRPGMVPAVEAGVVGLCAALGAAFALLLTLLGSAAYAAAVLMVWGVLLGPALRPDRRRRRHWLFRAALAAEVARVGCCCTPSRSGWPRRLPAVRRRGLLVAGVIELGAGRPVVVDRLRPALAGGFLPSLALVLVGQDTLCAG